MSSNNVELVQGLYRSFAEGDAAAVLGTLHPEIRWNEAESSIYADRNPYVGPKAVGEGVLTRLAEDWENFSVNPDTFIDGGDRVVVCGRYRGSYRDTGRGVNAQFVHVWTLSDGKVTAFQQYTDTAQFGRATG